MGLTINHKFISGKVDSADVTAIQPSNWNDTHDITGLSFVVAAWYDFTPIAPGGSLTAGITNTITLSKVPDGVNGSDAAHYLYISGGTGTAEAVLITGGTAVSGGSNKTISFIPANNHSGAWTIKSASAGIQEAAIDTPGGTVYVQDGISLIYAKLTLSSVNLCGASAGGTFLQFMFGNTDGIYMTGGVGYTLEISHLILLAGVTVTAGHYLLRTYNCAPYVHHITFKGGWGHWILDACPRSVGDSLQLTTYAKGIVIGETGGSSALVATNIVTSTDVNFSITLECRRGNAYISNSAFQHADTAGSRIISIAPNVGDGFGESIFTGLELDGGSAASIDIEPPIGATMFALQFSNIMFTGGAGPAHPAIVIGPRAWDVQFTGVDCRGMGSSGQGVINIAGGNNISFINLRISDASGAGMTGIACPAAVNNLSITDSQIGYLTATGAADPNFTVGINFGGFAHTPVTFAGNTIGAVTPIAGIPVAPVSWLIKDNIGLDDVIPSAVASATSIAAPINPVFPVSGTTTVTTITGGWKGRTIKIYKTDAGSLTIGGGGNIPGSHTVAQYASVTLTYDGTNWY